MNNIYVENYSKDPNYGNMKNEINHIDITDSSSNLSNVKSDSITSKASKEETIDLKKKVNKNNNFQKEENNQIKEKSFNRKNIINYNKSVKRAALSLSPKKSK